jgi:hypothetical protein
MGFEIAGDFQSIICSKIFSAPLLTSPEKAARLGLQFLTRDAIRCACFYPQFTFNALLSKLSRRVLDKVGL